LLVWVVVFISSRVMGSSSSIREFHNSMSS
jgi:hypothetical protein